MKFQFFLLISALILALESWGRISREDLGYSILLPEGWELTTTKENQDIWTYTDLKFNSALSIVRHPIDKSEFATPEEWTRAHFVAYKLVAETSQEPYGGVIVSDSSHERILPNGSWAPACYAVFLSATDDFAWEEFSVFSAHGDYGYEMYAIGDTLDMQKNIFDYAGILSTVNLSKGSRLYTSIKMRQQKSVQVKIWKDALGRKRKKTPALLPVFGLSPKTSNQNKPGLQ